VSVLVSPYHAQKSIRKGSREFQTFKDAPETAADEHVRYGVRSKIVDVGSCDGENGFPGGKRIVFHRGDAKAFRGKFFGEESQSAAGIDHRFAFGEMTGNLVGDVPEHWIQGEFLLLVGYGQRIP
jgi:hypothetical protein